MISRQASTTCSQTFKRFAPYHRQAQPPSSAVLLYRAMSGSLLPQRNHHGLTIQHHRLNIGVTGSKTFEKNAAATLTCQIREFCCSQTILSYRKWNQDDSRDFRLVNSKSSLFSSFLGQHSTQRHFSSRRRNDNNNKSKNSSDALINEKLLIELRKRFPDANGPEDMEVRLVIDEGGDEPATVQVCSLAEAIEISLDRMTDLIGVALKSDPPVIRAAQLSKLEYRKEQASAKQKSASKSKQKKTFRFRAGIDMHDLNRKIQDMTKFLEQGMECEYTVFSRARMMRENATAGKELVDHIQELVSHCAVPKNAPQTNENGNHTRVVLIPKKN